MREYGLPKLACLRVPPVAHACALPGSPERCPLPDGGLPLDAASLRSDIPEFRAGDTLKVNVKVVEGNRSRVQAFQGVVIARQGAGVRETFTIRKISFGVGVERTFPVNSPTLARQVSRMTGCSRIREPTSRASCRSGSI